GLMWVVTRFWKKEGRLHFWKWVSPPLLNVLQAPPGSLHQHYFLLGSKRGGGSSHFESVPATKKCSKHHHHLPS
ncbi:hypothetical protein VIGAN_06179900, partial [Vigna angularis var. angularis]